MHKKGYVVDRIEGNYVILEDNKENIINVRKSDIIGCVKEGDVLYIKNNFYCIDEEATKIRKANIDNLMKGLWEE